MPENLGQKIGSFLFTTAGQGIPIVKREVETSDPMELVGRECMYTTYNNNYWIPGRRAIIKGVDLSTSQITLGSIEKGGKQSELRIIERSDICLLPHTVSDFEEEIGLLEDKITEYKTKIELMKSLNITQMSSKLYEAYKLLTALKDKTDDEAMEILAQKLN